MWATISFPQYAVKKCQHFYHKNNALTSAHLELVHFYECFCTLLINCIRGSTDRLACYAVWFSGGRSAGCWSWWCQTPRRIRASTHAAEHHTTCGTDGGACPADTPDLPLFSYTSRSYRKGQERKSQMFYADMKSEPTRFLHISLCWKLLEVQVISSWLVLRWSVNPREWHLTLKPPWLNPNKQQSDWMHWAINPKGRCGFLLTSWHGYTSWRRRWTGSPSGPSLPLESPGKGNVPENQQRPPQKQTSLHWVVPLRAD